jgi:hypothetical protein
MPSSVVVNYGRKRTDKLGDGSFDAVELGGIFTVEIDENMDPSTAYETLFKDLKSRVDTDFEALPRNENAVPVSRPIRQEEEMPVPASPTAKLESWVQSSVDKETAVIKDRVQAPEQMPGEHLSGSGSSGEAHDEYGTPPLSDLKRLADAKQAVKYEGVKIFEHVIKPASNGNLFVKLRVGRRGPDGIPGQYANASSFTESVIDQARAVREGDLVNVYGYFKPWKNDPEKFNLELQKVELHKAD